LNAENYLDFVLYDCESSINEEKLALGHLEININDIVTKPGKWSYNEIRNLESRPTMARIQDVEFLGELYVQIMFMEKGAKNEPPAPALVEDLESQIKKKMPIMGMLVVVVHHATELVGVSSENPESTDPYAEIEFPNQQKLSTKILKGTSTPIWNQSFPTKMTITGDNFQPLHITVFNNTPTEDNQIGFCEIPLSDCYKKNKKWSIDGYYK
jgi:hypothetical protein